MSLRPRFLLLGFNVVVAALAFACTAPDEATDSSNDALNGSLANATTCAIRSAYAAAPLSAFKHVTKAELPAAIPTSNPTSIAKLDVPEVGPVFIVEEGSSIFAYDAGGARLGRAAVSGSSMTWFQPNETPASCGGSSADAGTSGADGGTVVPEGGTSGSDGGAAAATCLSTTPIDATQYEYRSPGAVTAGRCTSAEAAAISTYYKQHSTDADFSIASWKASTSAACGACAFGAAANPTWAPIMEGVDGELQVNRGGCIEQVSQSAACGRAYQQFQDCTLDACLTACTTQEEFTRCRADTTVLATSCKGAYDQLLSVCGSTNIGTYETKCKGTTYTFEGPIKVACVTGQ